MNPKATATVAKTSSAAAASTGETSRATVAAGTSSVTNRKSLSNGSKSSGTIRTRKKSSANGAHPNTTRNRNGSRSNQSISANSLVLWRRPFTTLDLFVRELWYLTCKYGVKTLQYYKTIMIVVLMLVSFTAMASLPGPYQQTAKFIYRQMLWCLYWCSLGVLSSIGLGTGLHTFLLYLGPHIAAVTLAAYECNSIAFPEPPYPDEIICPETIPMATNTNTNRLIDIWTIMTKVRLEAMCWGAGTALGELPPYFMAKAARLSNAGLEDDDDDDDDGDDGDSDENEEAVKKDSKMVKSVSVSSTEIDDDDDGDDDDDDNNDNNLDQLHLLQQKLKNHEPIGFVDRLKIGVEKLVARIGFFGILACASVPNPLFDLAGITCGHFLVPFWTFFGATLIGKAVIKMHIQQLFVIIAFNESLIENALQYLRAVPLLGKMMQEQFMQFLHSQKTRLHRNKSGEPMMAGNASLPDQQSNILGWIFEKFVILMVLYFVASIVNSLAQNQWRRRKNSRTTKRNLQ